MGEGMPQENCHVEVRGLATKFTWVESRKQLRAPDKKLCWKVEGKGLICTCMLIHTPGPTADPAHEHPQTQTHRNAPVPMQCLSNCISENENEEIK